MDDNLSPESSEEIVVDELDVLKRQATMMGISFSNNIKVDTLRERIQAKLSDEVPAEVAPVTTPAAAPAMSLRAYQLKEQTKLVRIRVTCMDPKKKELYGEVFTVSNEFIGTIRKFVPFGEQTDDGYHVPYIIYKLMDARKFLSIRTRKDRNTGHTHVDTSWAKEFAIEVLPPLSEKELNQLAIAQRTS